MILTKNLDIRPVFTFEDAGFPSQVNQCIKKAGFEKPFPIQSQSWPIIMSGHDYIGIAETGSGKTLSFLLPAVIHVLDQPPIRKFEGPVALVLAPTRELVEQIRECAVEFCPRMRCVACYGGASRMTQSDALKRGVEIVIACPGRLNDFISASKVSMRRVTYLVLDEADRMLDMGFEMQIRTIIDGIRKDRQMLFFSATWPKEVRSLALDLCTNDPVHVQIGSCVLKTSDNVVQHTLLLNESEKLNKLFELLQKLHEEDSKQLIIIFTETKKSCDFITSELRGSGYSALSIHGDKSQSERKYVLDEFKSGRTNILCATDVASRGLDVKNVKVVINYDMPLQVEDYVHRVGRTGRAGATGVAYSFFSDKNRGIAKDLVNILNETKQDVPQALLEMAKKPFDNRFSRFDSSV
ncbi:uncharacterized protein LOC142598159 [Dermatophagoides farinae]|uniref:uncharacterized protein LOC142598159 n=1 Tax=Dermatophagoides farinae TaxID=6954 RepID=UPI003F629AA1